MFRRDLARTGQYIPGYRLLDEENLAQKATLTSSGGLRLSALPPDGPLLHLTFLGATAPLACRARPRDHLPA